MKNVLTAFNTEVSDPSFAAVLVTLGFPLKKAPRRTVLADLNSAGGRSGGSVAWKFASESVTRPGLTFERVCALWGQPHVAQLDGGRPDDVLLCKRALHNYRVLLTQVHHNGRLWVARYGLGWRLSSWGGAEYVEVPQVDASQIPAGAPRSYSAAEIAVAVTLGVSLVSFAPGEKTEWHLGSPAVDCPWSAEMVLGVAGDEEYIRAHEDPLAVLHALFANRSVLAKTAANREAKTLILSKRGRYAVFSSTAAESRQEECLKYLNV